MRFGWVSQKKSSCEALPALRKLQLCSWAFFQPSCRTKTSAPACSACHQLTWIFNDEIPTADCVLLTSQSEANWSLFFSQWNMVKSSEIMVKSHFFSEKKKHFFLHWPSLALLMASGPSGSANRCIPGQNSTAHWWPGNPTVVDGKMRTWDGWTKGRYFIIFHQSKVHKSECFSVGIWHFNSPRNTWAKWSSPI